LHKVRDAGWGGALRVLENEAHIWVDDTKLCEQQRFMIAHEIGHLVLHLLGVAYQDRYGVTGEEDLQEVEADAYVAELLMPGWMLRAYLQSTADFAKLARRFEVSEKDMAIRLRSYFRM
jgi:Zn-dependent peptidase ImmA (M78 family)